MSQPWRRSQLPCGELDGGLFKTTPDFAVLVNGKGEIHEGKADRAYAKTKVRRRLTSGPHRPTLRGD